MPFVRSFEAPALGVLAMLLLRGGYATISEREAEIRSPLQRERERENKGERTFTVAIKA